MQVTGVKQCLWVPLGASSGIILGSKQLGTHIKNFFLILSTVLFRGFVNLEHAQGSIVMMPRFIGHYLVLETLLDSGLCSR